MGRLMNGKEVQWVDHWKRQNELVNEYTDNVVYVEYKTHIRAYRNIHHPNAFCKKIVEDNEGKSFRDAGPLRIYIGKDKLYWQKH